MSRLRKIFIRDKTYFITFRAEAGLPLPPTLLMNRILEGILCKAKSLYDIEVVCHKYMSNHVHMVVTVTCPDLVDDFIQYLKRESAHAVNRLLGRRKRTIWCAGYDSPIVLDLEKLLNIIAYIYTNASESGISDTIEEYPGLSSWGMFLSGEYKISRKRISRRALPVIGTARVPVAHQRSYIEELEGEGLEENSFILSPYAFLRSFETDQTEAELRSEIIARVRLREQEFRSVRTTRLKPKEWLQSSAIELEYTPRKFGKRMICHGSKKESRVAYINWFKALCEEAAYIYRISKNKIAQMVLPPGVFAPGGYLTANILPAPAY